MKINIRSPKRFLFALLPICLALMGSCDIVMALAGDSTIIVENKNQTYDIDSIEIKNINTGQLLYSSYNQIGRDGKKSWTVSEGNYEVRVTVIKFKNVDGQIVSDYVELPIGVSMASGYTARITYMNSTKDQLSVKKEKSSTTQ
ncbi:hypothetical protein [Leadbettera azotonutricia]|uniref:Putative lipoprotein n=1 Tax=Leadbettera azotonutricia (strain ATCC BAA-888 / DSM 13862 / ZAS-9) TaxID=545695 RepID=F5Y7A3_LEAAZ|nr:hypothetical protein [Leadbettera azotonutricia]AEF81641.1 putative lipoprotein [Leadbettera azotonutricia ZAS-9]